MKPTRTKEGKFLKNGLEFLFSFAIYYYVMLNDDKLGRLKSSKTTEIYIHVSVTNTVRISNHFDALDLEEGK